MVMCVYGCQLRAVVEREVVLQLVMEEKNVFHYQPTLVGGMTEAVVQDQLWKGLHKGVVAAVAAAAKGPKMV